MSDASINDLLAINNPHYRLIPETLGMNINNDLLAPTPAALKQAYSSGMAKGVIVDSERMPWYVRNAAKYDEKALADLRDYPLIWEESEDFSRLASLKFSSPFVYGYKAWLKIDPSKASKGAQKTGDCV